MARIETEFDDLDAKKGRYDRPATAQVFVAAIVVEVGQPLPKVLELTPLLLCEENADALKEALAPFVSRDDDVVRVSTGGVTHRGTPRQVAAPRHSVNVRQSANGTAVTPAASRPAQSASPVADMEPTTDDQVEEVKKKYGVQTPQVRAWATEKGLILPGTSGKGRLDNRYFGAYDREHSKKN